MSERKQTSCHMTTATTELTGAVLEVHGVGWNRSFLRHEGRCPEFVQPEQDAELGPKSAGELSFVQISDSHMGFNKPANPDVAGTLKAAVDKINALATPPEFILHTGDISHLSKPRNSTPWTSS